MSEPVIALNKLTKSYGKHRGIEEISFTVERGEIFGFIGPNGAGKSTTIRTLMGLLKPTGGTASVFGLDCGRQASEIAKDVGYLPSENCYYNSMKVKEMLLYTAELYGVAGHNRMEALAERLNLDLSRRIGDLSLGNKKKVGIVSALLPSPKLLIMDEPTTSLTDPEIERVFDMMRMLQKQNVAIVFISHKLKEVMEVCNRYTVLRDGNMVAAGPVAEVTTADLARFMVGHDVRTENLHQDKELGGEILRGEGLGDGTHFRDISFTVRAGEVLGVTGLLGDGRSELFQAVFGDLPYTGQLFVEGQPVKVTSTPQAIRLGIGYVPRNRKENGIIKDMDIVENGSMVTLPRLARRGLIDQRRRDAEFDRQVSELHIKMGKKTDLITSLSGGNQQKVVLAKWLSAHPKVLILDNPTQGVDVGAKEEIYDIILRLAREGVAVVVLSSEAQEIIRVCDRALVLYHGALQGEVSGADMNEQTIMHLATGGAAPSAQAIHTEE